MCDEAHIRAHDGRPRRAQMTWETPMRESEQVMSLVGDIYDAALDPALWPRALEKTAKFAGGAAAGLIARDVARKTGNVCHAAGTDPSYGPPYFETYIQLDPLSTPYQVLDVGNV